MMEAVGPCGLRTIRIMRDGRRRYDPAGVERLVAASRDPGASVAKLALQHGINANLLRKWIASRSGKPVSLAKGEAFVRVDRAAAMEFSSLARLRASLPNGVTLTLEGNDPQILSTMIFALGRLDVPSVG